MTGESALLSDYVARIAQLTAEREEIRRGFEDEVERQSRRADRAEAERDEARRDLHEERSRANDYSAVIDRERNAHERTKADLQAVRQFLDDNPSSLGAKLCAAQAELAKWKNATHTVSASLESTMYQRDAAQAEAAAMRGVLEEMAADDNVATSHRIYARIKLDAGVAAGLDLTEHMKRLEAVAAAAQRWAEKFQSDVPEAVAVREALAELAERGGE